MNKQRALPQTYRPVALLAVLAVMLTSLTVYSENCAAVRSGVLRLHVVANSDSEADQAIKLQVRDRLLSAGAECFTGSTDAEAAAAAVAENAEVLVAAANEVLRSNGQSYCARLAVEREYFDTRSYADITLPAGTYLAVRVVLGAGEGHNWWCVMFPPLCLPAATDASSYTVFSGENAAVVQAVEGFEVRFKIVEWWQKLLEKKREKQG